MGEPEVANDSKRLQKLMKEQAEISPIVEAYKAYKDANQTIEDSLEMLSEEKDEDMRDMIKEDLNQAKADKEALEKKLKVLLLPKDPNDDKNVIMEIRSGAGGDEAALFAAEIYRMYTKYIEGRGWYRWHEEGKFHGYWSGRLLCTEV